MPMRGGLTSRVAWINAGTYGRISGSASAHSSRTYSRHVFCGTKLGDRPSGLYTGDSMMSAPCLLARDRVVLAPVAATGAAAAAPLPVAMAMAGPGPGPAATMAGGGYAPAPANGDCTLHRAIKPRVKPGSKLAKGSSQDQLR